MPAMKPSSSSLSAEAAVRVSFERVEQRVFVQDFLEFAGEHLAELGVLDLLLLADVGDRRHEVFGRELPVDCVLLFVRKPVFQLHGHGDALLQGVGDLHRRDHQVAHRAQQEQHERDAPVDTM